MKKRWQPGHILYSVGIQEIWSNPEKKIGIRFPLEKKFLLFLPKKPKLSALYAPSVRCAYFFEKFLGDFGNNFAWKFFFVSFLGIIFISESFFQVTIHFSLFRREKKNFCQKKKVEEQGIDPCASCMLSMRSTIWATPPSTHFTFVIFILSIKKK